jgi:1,2-diacylglycerol-3-alpha-glucose alpha-1,2-galactosyltransferase
MTQSDEIQVVSGLRSLARPVILHAHTIGPVVLVRLLVHRGCRIVTAHITPGSLLGSVRCPRPLLGLVGKYMRFVYNRADSIIAVSQATAAEVAALKVRSPIIVTHNAIDNEPIQLLLSRRAELRAAFGWSAALVVLAVGQIQPRKGVEEFLACASALPQVHFVWVGGMPFGLLAAEREKLRRLCSAAPRNVNFAGLLPRPDVFRYYAAADVFFLPSHQETFGLAALEAATAGLPLLLRDLACYREWLDHAYLTAASVQEYVQLLAQLTDPKMRETLGERAKRAASGHGRQALITGLRMAYGLTARHGRDQQQ